MFPRFRRQVVLRIVIASALLLGLALGWAVMARWLADNEVRTAILQIEAADPNWTIEAITSARKPLAPADNGALGVEATATALPRDWPRWHRPPGPKDWRPVVVEEQTGPDLLGDIHKDLNEKVPYQDARLALDICAAELLRIELQRASKALAASPALDECLEGRFPVDDGDLIWGSSVNHFEKCRLVANLLQWDGIARCQRGDATGACRAALRIAAVGRALGNEWFIMEQCLRIIMMSMAANAVERGLSVGTADPELLKRMQELFEQEDRDMPGRLLHYTRPAPSVP